VLSDPGFQLSFAAVLGLLASAGLRLALPEIRRARGVGARGRAAAAGLLALANQSAFAEAGTLGIQVLHFGAVPVAGLVLNLAVIPLCGAFMAALLLHLGCALAVPPLAQAAAGAVEGAGILMLWLTAKVAEGIPPVPARSLPPLGVIAGCLAVFLPAAGAWEHARVERRSHDCRSARWCALVALLLAWGAPFAPSSRDRDRSVWLLALDVGQGDATVAHAPGGSILVDAGPANESRDEGRAAVEPSLRAEGIAKLDLVILSHAHRDHYGGLAWLAGRGFPRAVFENGSDPRGAWRSSVGSALARSRAPCVAVRSDTSLEAAEGLRFRILAKDRGVAGGMPGNAGENNRSLVAFLDLGGNLVCFAGDVERDAERALLPNLGRVRVMKVPHHGSKTSSDSAWIASTKPRIALISCGEGNRFGHPDRSTVGRYLLAGARVFRTDQEGAIRLTFTPEGAYVSTRAHPAPEFVRWLPDPPLTPSGQSP
jgi:competence protein ComEC